jgi:hypothetical protein
MGERRRSEEPFDPWEPSSDGDERDEEEEDRDLDTQSLLDMIDDDDWEFVEGIEDDDSLALDPMINSFLLSLSSIGIYGLTTTLFFSSAIEAGVFSLPITGAYAATTAFLDRNQANVTKTSLLRDFGRNMAKRSLCFGVFYGSFMASSGVLWESTDLSDGAIVIVSSMASVSLATISFRRPRLVFPGVGVLMVSAFLGIVP